MIWATVSSQSYFCWLCRVSPSLAAKNIINLIYVLTIWWCPCVESSLVLLLESVCYDQCILLAKLLAFALLHFVLQGQTCLLLQVSLDFLLLYSNPLWWKGHLFLVLVLEGLIGLHRTGQLKLLQHQWLGHRLGLLWCWVVCLGNKLRCSISQNYSTWTASSFKILNSSTGIPWPPLAFFIVMLPKAHLTSQSSMFIHNIY